MQPPTACNASRRPGVGSERTAVDTANYNPQDAAEDRTVCLAMVGDLLPAGPPDATLGPRTERRLAKARELLAGADVALANLECTLGGDGWRVASEPRVVTAPAGIRAIAAAGFNVLSLANNHMFDAGPAGFRQLRDLLGGLGVRAFGAGADLAEAARPAIVESKGIRLAFLAAADHRSGAGPFAAPGRAGVAPWDVQALIARVRELAGQVHHVIVCPHWGEERLALPAPGQVAEARRLIDAGASLVIGHHPHVVQGMERYGRGVIAYSLGNFVAGHVGFSDGDTLAWTRTERSGCLLRVRLSATEVRSLEQVPTYDDGQCVRHGASRAARRRLRERNRQVAGGVTAARYRRERVRVKTLLPIAQHLRWSRLRRLGWRNLRNAWRRLTRPD